jgi:hypothetical protein
MSICVYSTRPHADASLLKTGHLEVKHFLSIPGRGFNFSNSKSLPCLSRDYYIPRSDDRGCKSGVVKNNSAFEKQKCLEADHSAHQMLCKNSLRNPWVVLPSFSITCPGATRCRTVLLCYAGCVPMRSVVHNDSVARQVRHSYASCCPRCFRI